ncbi:hypothetical protein G6F70_007920 [Rhizopus microsporus]|uniref:Cyanovirin-N domain-containing protein n=1 Tax=Rhizopus azygosporus TaxID=86630 RepID=A0A367IZ37_RHIAZ|nr:hypothetical protein G6F71_007904 [Rhizopus microsporus]RCH82953.1 hypothetical protein CU097_006887 [Rhizopus azygosporus]KAG1195852.1 hypothetical protein G6F70_007920 [Rhizopus microsporus]KAG1211341.1 hypothetical protein G6F69_004664 [Rhizopus microsporus]KAG1233151.1 hypothetical protein G6F67_004492 [Rhizopus microsporus]
MKFLQALLFTLALYTASAYARVCCTIFDAEQGHILNGTKDIASIFIQTDGRDHADCQVAMVINADIKYKGKCTFRESDNLVTADIRVNNADYHVSWNRSKATCGAHNISVRASDWSNGKWELRQSSRSWSNCAPAWAGF